MPLELRHHLDRHAELDADGVTLLRYDYALADDPVHSPRPFLHPLRSRGGDLLTGDRPTDHAWHRGLSLTSAHLSDFNFWGGPTFVRDRGYTRLSDHGRQRPLGWDAMQRTQATIRLAHRLAWEAPIDDTADAEVILEESRELVATAPPGAKWWRLNWRSELRNTSDRTLEFGSPTTEGRDNAGYGGLFWRGPRDFAGGVLHTPDGQTDGDRMMGRPAAWLAYTGMHDGSLRATTLVFVDHPDNPRYPNRWFVRNTATPMVCFALAFGEIYPLPPGETLTLRYAIVIVDGAADLDALASHAEAAR